jgi:SPP1 family predicted phage head-tail adaptor
MTARRLLDQITIERLTRTVSPAGTPTGTWSPVATVRTQVLNQKLVERMAAYGEAAETTIGFRIHALPIEITTADRVIFDGEALDLKNVTEIRRGRLRMVEIVCRKVAK